MIHLATSAVVAVTLSGIDVDAADGGCVRQSQSAVKSRHRLHHWIIVGVLCILSLVWHVAVTTCRRLHRAYHLVELGLRRQQVPAQRASLAAGVVVVAVVVAGVAAVCGLGLYCWQKLTSIIAL